MRTLVLVPSGREFEYLQGGHVDWLSDPFRVCLLAANHWAVCGIGPASGVVCTLLIERYKPDRVVLVGLCGAYREADLEIGELVQCSSETFGDLGYTDNNRNINLDVMRLPMLPMQDGEVGCTLGLSILDQTWKTRASVTVSTLTTDLERSDHLCRDHRAACENMEGAAVALSCRLKGVPCYEIRAVSNLVGPRDPEKWLIEEPLMQLRKWLDARL